MFELFRTGALIVATITTGLMAGLFYAYACSVMPGLGRADDRTFVSAMQQINVAIVNGWFLIIFLGALGFTALAAALHLPAGGRGALPWIAAGLVLYVVALGTTIGLNRSGWLTSSQGIARRIWGWLAGRASGHRWV